MPTVWTRTNPWRCALARAGVTVDVVDWDDPQIDWSAFDRGWPGRHGTTPNDCRSFWIGRCGRFDDQLVNLLPAVRWSLDKQYLRELATAGVPITPTEFVPPGTTPEFPPGRFVVKPAVGAGKSRCIVPAGCAAFGCC